MTLSHIAAQTIFDRDAELLARARQSTEELGAADAATFRTYLAHHAVPRLTSTQTIACVDDLINMMRHERFDTCRATFAEWHRRIAPATIQRYAQTLLVGRK